MVIHSGGSCPQIRRCPDARLGAMATSCVSMSDVYGEAAKLPGQLRGSGSPQRYADLRATGATRDHVRWRVRANRLSRPFHGVLLDHDRDPDLLDRLYAAMLVLPDGAAVGFQTAAALHGFGVLRSRTLHVVVPRGIAVPQIRGISAHEAVLPFEPGELLGLPCLPAARTAVDLARVVRRLDALPILDAALRVEACSQDALLTEVAQHDRLRGVRQARELVPFADPRPECRQESQIRLVLRDGRVPAPVPQLVVADADGLGRCRIDLGYEEEQVGIEYDGESHLDRDRLRSDRSRHNWLESRGWAMRYFTDYDLYRRTDLLVSTVRAALLSRPRRSRANGG